MDKTVDLEKGRMLVFHKEFIEETVTHVNIMRQCDWSLVHERLRNGVIPAQLHDMRAIPDDEVYRNRELWTWHERSCFRTIPCRQAP